MKYIVRKDDTIYNGEYLKTMTVEVDPGPHMMKDKVAMHKLRQLLGMCASDKNKYPYVRETISREKSQVDGEIDALTSCIRRIDQQLDNVRVWIKDHQPILDEIRRK
jgi:hypothetical protein